MRMYACCRSGAEREGRKGTFRSCERAGEAQAWTGNAYVETHPTIAPKESVHKLTFLPLWAKFLLLRP